MSSKFAAPGTSGSHRGSQAEVSVYRGPNDTAIGAALKPISTKEVLARLDTLPSMGTPGFSFPQEPCTMTPRRAVSTTPPASIPRPGPVTRALMLILLVAAVIAPVVHLHVINRAMPPAKADLVPVWIGARVALHHGNPYSDETTRQIQIAYYGRPLRPSDDVNKMAYAYPAHTLILFAWIAPLSWPVVRIVFLILLPLLCAISVPLWLHVTGIALSRSRIALTLLLTLASWPVMWGVHQIQPTLVVAALVAAACFLLRREHETWAGILFALATIKPQLVGPLIAWLVLSALLRRRWAFIASLSVSLTVLLASATWLVPGWVANWRAAMADYVVYRHLKPDLQLLFGYWPGLALGLAIGAAAAFTLWRNRRCAPDSPAFGPLCALALAATVCLVPNEMAMIYNHVLLLPACLTLLFAPPASSLTAAIRRVAVAQIVADFAVVLVSVIAETTAGTANLWDSLPCMDFLLPTLLTAYLIFQLARLPLPVLAANTSTNFDAVSA